MKNMELEHIAKACGGIFFGGEKDLHIKIEGAVIDSRLVLKDYLYIPIKGARVDGHSFIPEVIRKGAAATLTEEKLESCEIPFILVSSCEQALKDIAAYYRAQLTIPVIGITGSVGKTSTKEMIASVLSQRFSVLKTAGNYNNEIGIPLTLLRINEEHEAAVVEMGISDFGEMHRLAEMAKPDICVITNIGTCHLENLKTRDGILQAKSEIFDFLSTDTGIVLNGDDDKLSTLKAVKGVVPVFYGLSEVQGEGVNAIHCELYADHMVNEGLKGVAATLHSKAGDIRVNIPIPGEHNIYNAMAATAVALALGMQLEEIRAGIEAVETIGGRTNLIEVNGLTIIDDCYNANPVSMKAALDVLEKGIGRNIAVLGDMGELGEDEKKLHYQVGTYLSDKNVAALFCAGSLAREIQRGACARENSKAVFYYETKEEMVSHLLSYLKKGDTVLIKASHFMEYSQVVEAIKAKEVRRNLLK